MSKHTPVGEAVCPVRIRLRREATDHWRGPLRRLRRRQRLLDALAELRHAAINLLHPRVEGLDAVDLLGDPDRADRRAVHRGEAETRAAPCQGTASCLARLARRAHLVRLARL
eukprot:scaffold77950_cov30-Phaeocystis_antarctica.AAC.1